MQTNTRLRSLLVSVLVASNALIAGLSWIGLEHSRQLHEQRARAQTQNIARALDQTLANIVDKIDLALRNVSDELERQLANGGIDERAMAAFIARQEQRLPEVEAFRIADASGRVILGKGVDKNSGASWVDREYFIYHREHADRQLQISKPALGRVAKKYITGFAQRYNHPDGSFAGVVSAPVAVSHFSDLLKHFELGQHGSIVLRDADLGLIARSPAIPDKPAGQIGNAAVSEELRKLIASGVHAATYFTPAASDGVERIITFNRASKVPMYLLVGAASEDYLADWRTEAGGTAGIVLGYLLLSLLLGRWILKLLEQAQRDAKTLAERESRLQAIIEHEPECIKVVDAAGILTAMNPAGLAMIEADSPDQAIGLPVIDLIVPEDRAAFADLHRRVIGGESVSKAFQIIGLKGSRRWMETHATPMQDGNQVVHLAITRDISQRKAAEAELEQHRRHLEQLVAQRTAELLATEARASQILKSSADGIYGVDAAGIVTFINPAACKLLGYRAEEVVGQSAHALFHHSHADGSPYPAGECPSHRGMREGCVVRHDDEVYWHADGHPIPVMYAVHPVVENGTVTGAVTSFVDISTQRAAGEAREQALQAAETLARVRREFLANMSHEIRTPLNGILGFAEIGLRNSTDPEKAANAFAKIQTSGKRLLGVINDILDFSKIEAGKLNIEQIAVSVREVAEHAVELIRERARAKGLALELTLAADLPAHCLSDPLRMGQVLINIADNAVKFTERGSVAIAVSRHGDDLLFRVADTGIGMTAEQQAQLFNPFQQADASSTRRFGGTGLGLAISRRIVELMHGTIAVSSLPGQGTTVEFTLPCMPTDETLAARPIAAAHNEKPLAGYSILAAEDEPVNQAILRELLGELGATTVVAGSGREAVDCVASHGAMAYDLVLMDIQMPEMDGYEAARRIRAIAPGLPIVAQTAHAFSEERERCLAAGMQGHLAKPLDIDELLRLIAAAAIRPQVRAA